MPMELYHEKLYQKEFLICKRYENVLYISLTVLIRIEETSKCINLQLVIIELSVSSKLLFSFGVQLDFIKHMYFFMLFFGNSGQTMVGRMDRKRRMEGQRKRAKEGGREGKKERRKSKLSSVCYFLSASSFSICPKQMSLAKLQVKARNSIKVFRVGEKNPSV